MKTERIPPHVLERFRVRLDVEQAKNKPRAEELREILLDVVNRDNQGKQPLLEDRRRRMVEILRRTQPIAVEDREWYYKCLDESVEGQFKALAIANEGGEHPSVGVLVGCLGHLLSDVKLT